MAGSTFSPRGLAFFILTIVFLTLDAVSLVLRFMALRRANRKFYTDDGFVLFSFANAVALGGVGIWACLNGLGKSVTELNAYEIAAASKLLFTAYICWLLSSVFYKLAILSLYNRVFTTKKFRMWSYATMGLTVAYCISYFCVYMTNCVPLDYMWNPTPGGSCRSGQVSDYSTLAINLVIDLAILILPLPTLWSLQLPTRKKIVVTVMLSFGLLTIAVMVWRAVWTHQYRDNPDFTSFLPLISIVACCELWLGILVANIPTLAPLFRGSRWAMGTTGNSHGASSYSRPSSVPLRSLHTHRSAAKAYDEISLVKEDRYVELQSKDDVNFHSTTTTGSVTAECAFDPNHQRGSAPLGSKSIYVQTKISV